MNSEPIIIIGSGIAGLYCALKLLPRKSCIISRSPIGEQCSSQWAQGGIAAAYSADDSPQLHIQDTIKAGNYCSDIEKVSFMANHAKTIIDDLIKMGVNFDKDATGNLRFNHEAAHSKARVIGKGGDQAGKYIMAALTKAVRASIHIELQTGIHLLDLQVNNNQLNGIIVRDERAPNAIPYSIKTNQLVLATGGIGQLYATTTNPKHTLGEGLGMAYRAGAVIKDAEFVQFHPTALDIGQDPAPLVTEALRGEGAYLINNLGHRFMLDVHKDAELAPRDVVSRAIFSQIQAGKKVFLDGRENIGNEFPTKFKTVYASCMAANIDPIRQPIPVKPAAHYHMGGISVNTYGKTSINGLWACGEVTHTGVHGANRLASNSLLEALVFSENIAKNIVKNIVSSDVLTSKPNNQSIAQYQEDSKMLQNLKQAMQDNVGIIRNKEGLNKAKSSIMQWQNKNGDKYPMVNILALAALVTQSAIDRKHSIGAHYRDDIQKNTTLYKHLNYVL